MSESTLTIDKQGNKLWRNSKGEYHREGGPAIEWASGNKVWRVNGKCHRLNGPAVEWAEGSKSWYINGEWLGFNDKGFWALWKRLTTEQKTDPVLLSHLPISHYKT